ncbi:folylpolyglutamate synthase-like isoform X2 [Cicer arietinum]|uniref:folylpolyglutamate synthase-like isoform X2 n=1 Tax=Cicer arietinum TaxID=3827 RepID=UPI003CC65C53
MSEQGGDGSPESQSLTSYEEALEALSSLIIKRTRADGSNMGDQFDVLFEYLKLQLSLPCLIDIRERFRLDGNNNPILHTWNILLGTQEINKS